jgi:hypothetical protein
MGEIENTSPDTIRSLEVTAHLYDKDLEIVGIEKAFHALIEPGQRETFEILADPTALLNEPESFKLS